MKEFLILFAFICILFAGLRIAHMAAPKLAKITAEFISQY